MLLNCTCTVSVWNNGTSQEAVTLLSILPSSGCRDTVGRTRRTRRRRHVRRHIRPIHRRIHLAAAYPAIIIYNVVCICGLSTKKKHFFCGFPKSLGKKLMKIENGLILYQSRREG